MCGDWASGWSRRRHPSYGRCRPCRGVWLWFGLDVHQAQTVAAVLDPVSGELHVQRLRGAPGEVVPVFMQRLARPVRAVYEAGPTGFGLARAAAARGLDLRVVAPGSIPRAPGDRVKTDRRDAKRLVRLFAAGELSFAFVPSEEDERFRDLVRCIDDARKDLMRSRLDLTRSCGHVWVGLRGLPFDHL